VTYFDDGCREVGAAIGMKGFWMTYFGFRAAPLGPVGPAPVEAIFAGFRPAWVSRALPDAWTYASPEACLSARATSAAAALRRVGVTDEAADRAAALLAPVADGLVVTGRPLAAANAVLPLPDDPVERLWQLTTTLREHRGDTHVAAIATCGLSGLDAHLLHVAAGEATWGSRGWTDDERAAAEAQLRDRGLLAPDGTLTNAGAELRAEVEARTDAASCSAPGVDDVVAELRPLTGAAESLLWYPNPIGLPPGG
jgi:diadenosine tetraphosphatase ApaH/serine/threonine PP2A family protein phosphatase